jgi:dTDP-4-amino-4,6-dideoxygalactose transaminase
METTERVADEILSLPIYPELSAGQVRQVAAMVLEWDRAGDAG